MDQDKKQQSEQKKQSEGGLVGNHQESNREAPGPDAEACERAPGGLVGNHQRGKPDCEAPAAEAAAEGAPARPAARGRPDLVRRDDRT
ncbi:hypothetical protein [Xanthobacter sp. KR7-225]|uniref:hypothetical protein n=1 Tax=Xanthobacter sp. KR7-225 TaxID=3156613 RepID=UPI0032B39445